MTTLVEFRLSLRNLLTDKTQWRDALLTNWIQDAVRDYSLNFPRLVRSTIAAVTGTSAYSLSAYTMLTVRAVEYPAGESPRRLLAPRSRADPGFTGSASYDLSADFATLYLGETPATGESILVEYDSVHAVPTSDAAELTIPPQHSELLRLYVIWKACVSLEMDENVSVDRQREMMNALGLNAYRAERAYRSRLKEALRTATHSGIAGQWRMDKYDRP